MQQSASGAYSHGCGTLGRGRRRMSGPWAAAGGLASGWRAAGHASASLGEVWGVRSGNFQSGSICWRAVDKVRSEGRAECRSEMSESSRSTGSVNSLCEMPFTMSHASIPPETASLRHAVLGSSLACQVGLWMPLRTSQPQVGRSITSHLVQASALFVTPGFFHCWPLGASKAFFLCLGLESAVTEAASSREAACRKSCAPLATQPHHESAGVQS